MSIDTPIKATIECDVAIVGGAVAGAALACHLRESGLRVVILETTKTIPPVNRGDSLAPCTVRRLAELGALPAWEKRGAIQVRQWRAVGPEGETLLTLRIADTAPKPYNYVLCLPHPLIEEALLETALSGGSVSLMRGTRVTGLLKDDRGAVVGVRAVRGLEPIEIQARVVVGCDGAGSLVRQQADLKTSIETYPYQYLMLTCVRSPEQPDDQNLEIWGADGFCGLYPITAEHVRCPVQAVPGEFRRWREIGLARIHEEMKSRFPYFATMQPIADDLHFYKILRHNAECYVGDGVIIIGDAAHCTPPYYGMGMNMAVRDAYHAANLLIPMLKAGARPTREDLMPFDDKVRTFNQFVVTASWQYGAVAAAHRKTTAEVQKALSVTTALDPDVMAVIYADYDAPPPREAEPARVSRRSGLVVT